MSLPRRTLLTGALATLAVGCGVPGVGNDRTFSGQFHSRWMEKAVGWTIHYPPGHGPGDRLPVVISLHGRGGSHSTTFTQLHLGDVVDDAVREGARPFAIASVDGGEDGYWHRRADGTDAGAMVRDSFVPVLRQYGLRTSQLALYGWSMGGFGALLLTGKRLLGPRAVAVSSPALFASAGVTAAGAFDDAADFDRNDVAAHPEWFRGVPLRIDIGRSDPFYEVTQEFVHALHPRPAGGFESGGHDPAFWRRMAPVQMRFLARWLGD